MKWAAEGWSPIVFIAMVLLLEYRVFLHQKSVDGKEAREAYYHDVLVEGFGYYSIVGEKNADIGSVFMAKLLAKKEPYFDSSLLEGFQNGEFASNPFMKAFNSSYGLEMNISRIEDSVSGKDPFHYNNRFYSLDQEFMRYLEDPTDDVLIKALYCAEAGYGKDDFLIVEKLAGLGGYEETHALMALIFIEGNKCYESKKITGLKKQIAHSLVSSQERERYFSDLYAERIVVLYWGGFGSYVIEDWVKKVSENQNVDGGWGDGENISNPHTTGLAMLSLEYFIEGDLKQDLFVD